MSDDDADAAEVASAIARVSRRELARLTDPAARLYRRFEVQKPLGGVRAISAPIGELKSAQWAVSSWLTGHVQPTVCAHGFVPGRSPVTNAAAHVNKAVVVSLDVDGFFPSINYRRVVGVFRVAGLSVEVARMLAMICTEPPGAGRIVDRLLPQGSPASPAITNVLCRQLDRRLFGLASSFDATYTRYADDVTFSADAPIDADALVRTTTGIMRGEGFAVRHEKTRVMLRHERQTVTGIVVNSGLSLPREYVDSALALADARPPRGSREWDVLVGRLSWLRLVDRRTAERVTEAVRRRGVDLPGWTDVQIRSTQGPAKGPDGRRPTVRSSNVRQR